ncbi:MAG: YrdB family protein [Dehalococcoidia bacterium]|nr:YrdB family protein [Dehalococcoidia bacterium]
MRIGPNDVLRFFLELAGLAALAWWGFGTSEDGALRWSLGLGAPLMAAAAWGAFRVPHDPKPDPPVEVPGGVRLALEGVFFTAATAALYAGGAPVIALAFAAVVLAHYAVAHDRVARLLHNRPFEA